MLPVRFARGPRDDQPPIGEHGMLIVDRLDAAVRVGERDREIDAGLFVPLAVDEANRAGVRAVAAVHAGNPVPADHELVDVRLIPERRSPSAPPVVGVERGGRLREHECRKRQ